MGSVNEREECRFTVPATFLEGEMAICVRSERLSCSAVHQATLEHNHHVRDFADLQMFLDAAYPNYTFGLISSLRQARAQLDQYSGTAQLSLPPGQGRISTSTSYSARTLAVATPLSAPRCTSDYVGNPFLRQTWPWIHRNIVYQVHPATPRGACPSDRPHFRHWFRFSL